MSSVTESQAILEIWLALLDPERGPILCRNYAGSGFNEEPGGLILSPSERPDFAEIGVFT